MNSNAHPILLKLGSCFHRLRSGVLLFADFTESHCNLFRRLFSHMPIQIGHPMYAINHKRCFGMKVCVISKWEGVVNRKNSDKIR